VTHFIQFIDVNVIQRKWLICSVFHSKKVTVGFEQRRLLLSATFNSINNALAYLFGTLKWRFVTNKKHSIVVQTHRWECYGSLQ